MTQLTATSPTSALVADRLLYDQVAGAASAAVIRRYSSSFGLSSRLLHRPVRDHIRNVYALVRLADEVVDGSLALQHPTRARRLLDRLEAETGETLAEGYSTNLVVHAFGTTARACGIEAALLAPFFASMRTDLTVQDHDLASFGEYVYGSAEVVGLMCLRVFLADGGTSQGADGRAPVVDLADGARRLGAAFQKVNFLRDIAADFNERGRSYFPGVDPTRLSEADKVVILDDIDADLVVAGKAVGELPHSSRAAVMAAHAVFSELSSRLRATPAAAIAGHRISVPATVKARVALTALARSRRS